MGQSLVAVSTLSLVWTAYGGFPDRIIPAANLKPTGYQKWAHLNWVWLHNGQGNQSNVLDLVQGYNDNQIPIGAVNIDSTWATQFNNFEVNTEKFPDFPGLIQNLHDQGLKVTLWATSMVNVENPDYQMCVEKGYLLRDSRGIVRPMQWWHGYGALLDYSNPDAVAWWHSNMDKVLNVGVDGFKCDGTDPYVLEYSITGGAKGYNDQTITYRDYANMYYRDFLYYTRQKRSTTKTDQDAGLIMSRPVDCLLDRTTKVCHAFSPGDVMASGWVGDDDATFPGMTGCLRKTIYSAWVGYGNFGCDVGGYRGDSNDLQKELFLRWAQLGSFMSLMENGGGGEHRPWMYDDETVNIYRKFAVQHHRISAYMHTMGANALDAKTSSMHPVDDRHIDINNPDLSLHVVFPEPTTYSYRLGDDLLIHPVIRDVSSNKTTDAMVKMSFPKESDGSTNVWLDWWMPNDMRRSHKSGEEAMRVVPLDSYAVYVREGALLPLHAVSKDDAGIEHVDMQSYIFTWFHPSASNATKSAPKVFNMRESITTGLGITATGYYSADNVIIGEISAHPGAGGFDLVGVSKPSDVKTDAWPDSKCTHRYEVLEQTLHVSCQSILGGLRVQATF